MNTAYKVLLGFAMFLGVVALGNAAVISYFGAGAVDQVGVAIVNYLTGENTSFAQNEKVFTMADGPWEFEKVASSATDQSLGTSGSTGDYLAFCTCQVTTSGANGTCGIEDGTNTAFDNITSVPASTPIGIYTIPVYSQATTAAGWEATTGSAATMQCYGRFDTSGD
jgi:hypothetical protein